MGKAIPLAMMILFPAGCSRTGTIDTGAMEAAPSGAPADAAESVLKRAAEAVCPPHDNPGLRDPFQRSYESSETEFSIFCAPAAGHSVDATLSLFASVEEARKAFEGKRGRAAVRDFHGCPLAVWEEDSSDLPGGGNEFRIWLWQAGPWVADGKAFDDTPSLSAPAPERVSEEIYKAGKELGLFD